MATITYYVAMKIIQGDYGDVYASDAVECRSSAEAVRLAHRYAREALGAIAFSRSGDPALGEFEPAVILAKLGELPSDAMGLMDMAA